MDDSADNDSNSYDLLKADPETVDFSRLDILAIDEWKDEKELHSRMVQMLLDDAPGAILKIDDSIGGGKEAFERAVHYFKGSADVVRADRLAMVCKLILKRIRADRLEAAKERVPEIRERFQELKQSLLESGYLGD